MTTTRAPRIVHIVDAHLTYPNWSEGALNAALIDTAKQHLRSLGHIVTGTEIEAGYDVGVEVQRYLDADLVILQTPINWFGAPWIYKRYVDEVFNEGLHSKRFMVDDGRTRSDPTRQYGTGGHMQGRGFFISSTWNAPSTVFDDPRSVMLLGKSADDLLLNLTANYRFVGFSTLENFALYDIFRSGPLEADIEAYRNHLDRQLAVLPDPISSAP